MRFKALRDNPSLEELIKSARSEELALHQSVVVKESQLDSSSNASYNFHVKSDSNKAVANGKCYRCQGDHHIKNCPQLKKIKCFKCSQLGHIAKYCTTEVSTTSTIGGSSGNEAGMASAPVAIPRK